MTDSMSYLELNLPTYLIDDIKALEKAREENDKYIDALYNEVQSSINIAYYGNYIDDNQANYLRRKYLLQEE